MKKLLFVAMCLFALVACKQEKPAPVAPDGGSNDSLENIIREINEAENRVSVAKSGERADKAQQIREDMQFIADRMAKNRELLKKLQGQMKEGTLKSEKLQKTIESLLQQMEQKDAELQELRASLDAKDIHIGELDEQIADLNDNVSNLRTESEQKTETINTQDRQLNTAWYVFGTKKELREQGILQDGQVLRGNFNKNYFTKIDIRNEKEIKLYSKSAKLLTMHPSSSYTLAQDANKQYTLRITNPQIFWSTSKYLVVLVK